MINFDEKRRFMAMLPDFQLMSGVADAEALKGTGAVDARTSEEVLTASAAGLGRREIFYAAPNKENLGAVLDKCRVVANSMEELIAINEAASAAGNVIMVGLRLAALDFCSSAMTTNELRSLVHDIKQLKYVSVCGCIVTGQVEGLHGKELGKYVRSSYRTAKDMTYILPCTMPYIVVEGLLEAMAWNESEHPEDFQDFLTAANIVGMQNSTAFYADYYVE